MSLRLSALLLFALAPLAACAADEENPFKGAKVGDFARYDVSITSNGKGRTLSRVQAVTAAGEKEVTLKTVTSVGGKELPNAPSHTIDLTRPFNAVAADEGLPTNPVKWEKVNDGREKVNVGGKDYECTWVAYKPVPNKPGGPTVGELKVWRSKETPFVVRRLMRLQVGPAEVVYEATLVELGPKK